MTAFRGMQLARAVGGISWSGLAARSSVSNLQALATNSARNYARSYAHLASGSLAWSLRVRDGLSTSAPSVPARQLRRFGAPPHRPMSTNDCWIASTRRINSNGFRAFCGIAIVWRLCAETGCISTQTCKGHDGNGLAGVNIHTGQTEREIRMRDLDERFITDEALGLMFISTGNRLLAYSVTGH